MSNVTISGNAAGTATFIVQSPGTSTNRTLTLPDATTTLVGTDATQTLTNKTIQGGTLALQTAQNSTSGTFIDFTGIPSWVKRVTIMLSGVSTNGTSNTMIQLGTSAGVTTSGYLGASGGFSSVGSEGISFTTGFGLSTSTSAATTFHAIMIVANVTGNTWVASVAGGYSDVAALLQGGGSVTLSGTLDRVRLTTVGGANTFDAGTVNVMWEG